MLILFTELFIPTFINVLQNYINNTVVLQSVNTIFERALNISLTFCLIDWRNYNNLKDCTLHKYYEYS